MHLKREKYTFVLDLKEEWSKYELRHDICPKKNYTAGFSGQTFYTLNFTKFQQFW